MSLKAPSQNFHKVFILAPPDHTNSTHNDSHNHQIMEKCLKMCGILFKYTLIALIECIVHPQWCEIHHNYFSLELIYSHSCNRQAD